jgi:carbohydrate-selective porin OprB
VTREIASAFRRACVAIAAVSATVALSADAFAQAGGAAGGGPAGPGGAGGGSSGAAPAGGANAPAEPIETAAPSDDLFKPWFDAKRDLERRTGTRIGLNVDLTNQQTIAGPDYVNRSVARYDLGIHQMLWRGAEADLVVRGGWGDGPDAAPDLLNTVNTNQYARTGSDAFVLHLWVQQKLFDDQLTLRAGKMDLGDWMDTNRFGFYNFVGYSFAHNSSIPLPGNPLAAMVTFEPKDVPWLYVSAGAANAAQSSYRAGFEELLDGPTALFTMAEVGIRTEFKGRKGTYRFIGWYDGRNLPSINGSEIADDGRAGFAVSFDQEIAENFGLFFRYGIGDQNEFEPREYWSVGFDWTGPIPGRPRDDLAVGFVMNRFGGQRDDVVANAADYETYVEAYYNYRLSDAVQLQPMVQVVTDPGGTNRSTEVVLGLHVALRL